MFPALLRPWLSTLILRWCKSTEQSRWKKYTHRSNFILNSKSSGYLQPGQLKAFWLVLEQPRIPEKYLYDLFRDKKPLRVHPSSWLSFPNISGTSFWKGKKGEMFRLLIVMLIYFGCPWCAKHRQQREVWGGGEEEFLSVSSRSPKKERWRKKW